MGEMDFDKVKFQKLKKNKVQQKFNFVVVCEAAWKQFSYLEEKSEG